jgi:hypothetical protein
MAWLVYTAQFLRMLEVLVATKMAARQIQRISDSPALLDFGSPFWISTERSGTELVVENDVEK